ncbi:MAG: VWA domain-containing protein [Phycisphaerae bacterium]|nr:VWA domain-containing protein [Phycisphaerae bacterium]
MATEFRCDKCGKSLLTTDAPGTLIACPNCGSQVPVPSQAGPASADGVEAPPPQRTPPPRRSRLADVGDSPPSSETAPIEEGQLSERAVGALAVGMPWGISVVFHAGIFLVLLFLFMTQVIGKDPEEDRVIIPDARLAEDPGAMINPEKNDLNLQNAQSKRQTKRHKYKTQPAKNMLADAAMKKKGELKIIGIGQGSGGGPSAYGLSVGEGDGPRASFYGSGGNAYKICYVIDRSGSLLDTFFYLRDEIKRSIRALVPQQQFHVIFFSQGKPEEMPAKKLVYATQANKDAAFKYLDTVVPGGQTDPGPALERAFHYKPELIYFMTDGDFSADVLERLRQLNRDKKIKINTFSFVFKPGEELLRQIAEENGGRYKHVSEDDLGQ